MGTELNFTARLDTSQFLSQIDQARTQFNLAFGGGGAGGLSGQFQQMFSGMAASPQAMGFGQTFTNPAIAYSPFFGAIQATTQLDQEWAVHRYGYTAAMMMKPPGVSAAEYASGVEGNFIDRQIDARHMAAVASRSTFYGGIGGMAGGEIAGAIGGWAGSMAGGALAGRLFGPGAVGAGKMIGGLAGSWMAFDVGMNYVSDKIENHFAKAEQIGGYTRELGDLAGSGRGLGRSQRYELGIAARGAAGDLKMDVQEMGEVLSLGRQSGMLPNATDPSKAREQYRDFARAIEEGAQVLGTSLAGATQVIKAATAHGMTAREGVLRAAGAGGADAFMGQLAQQDYVQSIYQGMANGPMGNMQLMAAMGGQSIGMGMYDLPGAAMGGLMANGGDLMSNMGSFMVHRDQYMRGIGPGGARTMARQQIQSGGEMIQSFAPDMSSRDAQALFMMSQGLDPATARMVVGGGPGHGQMSYEGTMAAAMAAQGQMLGVNQPTPVGGMPHSGLQMSGTLTGAMIGGQVAGPWGALGGAAIGFVAQNYGHMRSGIGDLFSGDIFLSPQELADKENRQMAGEYDAKLSARKAELGMINIDAAAGVRFLRADLRGARLDADGAGSSLFSQRGAGMLMMSGLHPVEAGPGTIRVDGSYFNAMDVQRRGRDVIGSTRPLGESDEAFVAEAAYRTGYGGSVNPHEMSALRQRMIGEWSNLTGTSGMLGWAKRSSLPSARSAAEEALKDYDFVINESDMAPAEKQRLIKAGANSELGRKYLSATFGYDFQQLDTGMMAAMVGSAGMSSTEAATTSRERHWFHTAYADNALMRDDRFVSAMQSTDLYAKAKLAMNGGDYKKANQLMHQAAIVTQQDLVKHGREDLRSAAAPDIDVNRQVLRGSGVAVQLGAEVIGGALVGLTRSLADRDTAGAAMVLSQTKEDLAMAGQFSTENTSLVSEAMREKQSAMSEKTKDQLRHGRGMGTMERAVGFGEQESALASINRSLRSTERSLKDLSDKISSTGGKPVAPTTGGH